MINRLYAWLWSFLPDRCEVPGCSRQGVRGNENRIGPHVVCDYCHFSGKGKAWADLVEESEK